MMETDPLLSAAERDGASLMYSKTKQGGVLEKVSIAPTSATRTKVLSAVVLGLGLLVVVAARLGGGGGGVSDRKEEAEESARYDKWVVITSIQSPTSDVKKMCAFAAQALDVNMVVVADTKTPTDWHAEGCFFLSVEAQKHLGFKTADILPYKNYARKNIGYLYAMSKGATHIYETDDDNLSDLGRIFAATTSHDDDDEDQTCAARLVNDGVHDAQNVYAYFGAPGVWPRGFPLNDVNNTDGNNVLSPRGVELAYTPIKSYLVNGDPDTDAIFRLTRGEQIGKVKLTNGIPPLTLDRGVMCPFNSQAVLWSRASFLLMMIPSSTPMRVCDIWRGYFSQRLLWEMGGRLLFGQAGVVQVRGTHDYLEDFMDEIELYRDTRKLMDVLLGWKPRAKTMDGRFLELCGLMSQGEFWSEDKFCEAWVHDLKHVGYQFPPVEEEKDTQFESSAAENVTEEESPRLASAPEKADDLGETVCGEEGQTGLREWVRVRDTALLARMGTEEENVFAQLKKIKLLVMINHADNDKPWMHRTLSGWYGPFFHSVEFIGGSEKCNTYLDGASANGATMLKCFADAARAEPATSSLDGIMMIPDDVFFKPWLLRLPSTAIWAMVPYTFAPGAPERSNEGCPAGLLREHVEEERWPPGEDRRFNPAAKTNGFDFKADLIEMSVLLRANAQLNNLLGVGSVEKSWGAGKPRPFNCVGPKLIADVLYVPRASVQFFGRVVDQVHLGYRGKNVWVENTMGTILHIMEKPSKSKTLSVPTAFNWDYDVDPIVRVQRAAGSAFDAHLPADTVVFHPVKFGMGREDATVQHFIDRFLTEQIEPAAKRAAAAAAKRAARTA
jgi:hypothetical protein